MPSSSQDIPFIVEQIARCVRLSKRCSDPEIAEKLVALARTFAQRAVELGADPDVVGADLEGGLAGVARRGWMH